MGKKRIYRMGAFLLPALLLLLDILPCQAAQIGFGAVVESTEEAPFITSVSISPGTAVVSKDTK